MEDSWHSQEHVPRESRGPPSRLVGTSARSSAILSNPGSTISSSRKVGVLLRVYMLPSFDGRATVEGFRELVPCEHRWSGHHQLAVIPGSGNRADKNNIFSHRETRSFVFWKFSSIFPRFAEVGVVSHAWKFTSKQEWLREHPPCGRQNIIKYNKTDRCLVGCNPPTEPGVADSPFHTGV